MCFVGNRGCIQIHTGPVKNIKIMGPWLNVMDPGFNLHRLVGPDRPHFLLLDRPQEFRLRRQRQFADLVEEQRAHVGLGEVAGVVADRARERALDVAEELALEELVRDGGAVHLDQRAVGAPAARVNGVCHQFLACTRFTSDEHGAIHGRYCFHVFK
jgi:hypothetical protein